MGSKIREICEGSQKSNAKNKRRINTRGVYYILWEQEKVELGRAI